MKIAFSEQAWVDYAHWQKTDLVYVEKINGLIKECTRNPFKGTGKLEPLRRNLKGHWSRRISQEHRLVYRVSGSGADQMLEVMSCRYHYEKN